jgi:porin
VATGARGDFAGLSYERLRWSGVWGIDRKGGFLGNFNSTVELNTEKLGLWKGGKALIYGVGVYGVEPTKFVADYQYTDNIEAIDQYILYQAWYSQAIIEDTLDILVGVHDFNTEFVVSDFALPLINSSFWLPVTISQRASPTYPTTGLGVRVKVQPTSSS